MPLWTRPPGPSLPALCAMPSRPPAIVLSVPLTPCSVSHRASGRADGSWADVNGPSRFGLIAARLRWKRPARMPSLDRLARGRFEPACAGRFSTVKYSLDRVGTTNRASDSLASYIRTRGMPWVERGSQLTCAALIASHAPICRLHREASRSPNHSFLYYWLRGRRSWGLRPIPGVRARGAG